METTTPSEIILGIDPGTVVMGYGVIAIEQKKIKLISLGVVKLNQQEDSLLRLKMISEKVVGLVNQYKPTATAIEAPFFGKNVQSMLKLGRAQGVCIAASLVNNVPVYEYSPKKIKQSITGNGNASKEQIAAMLKQLCGFEIQPKFLDATDGLAAAVCHHFQNRVGGDVGTKKVKGWGEFLAQNSERIKKK